MTIESLLPILLQRLRLPEGEVATEAQLQAEFEAYLAELKSEEEARLAEIARIEDLKARYEALSDKGLIQGSLSISNPDFHFANLLQADPVEAEAGMVEMEEAYHNLLSELSQTSYVEQRQVEYAKIDNLLLEALAEQAEGRPEKMVEYLALREQIKLNFPKV